MQKTGNRIADTIADLEQAISNEPMAKDGCAKFDTQVCVHVHSVRHRLADPDGISAKAAIDGLVACKILSNDTTEQIKQVTFSQSKGGPEKTIITITAVEGGD